MSSHRYGNPGVLADWSLVSHSRDGSSVHLCEFILCRDERLKLPLVFLRVKLKSVHYFILLFRRYKVLYDQIFEFELSGQFILCLFQLLSTPHMLIIHILNISLQRLKLRIQLLVLIKGV